MIEIVKKTEEKCEDCGDFCPTIRNKKFHRNDEVVHVTELYCGHQELCDGLEKFIKKKQEVSEQ